MNCMNSSIEIKDLCQLIRECGRAGVVELTLDPVRVVFSNRPAEEEKQSLLKWPAAAKTSAAKFSPEQNEIDLMSAELSLREDQLANALLEDPAEYERLMMAGELDDAATEH